MKTPSIPGYERLRSIGTGGFGDVFEAWQPTFNRRVAIKVLTQAVHSEIDRAAFFRECQALGSVSEHPNVVTVFEAGVTDSDQPFIAMELYKETLRDKIARSGGFIGHAEALDCGVQMCAALQRAHSERILHRDIKPQNILYSAYDVPALGDFGIASLAGDNPNEAPDGVTINYAAPEVLAGGEPSIESDLYSLGATLYTALAGHRPFKHANDTDETLTARIMTQRAPRIETQVLPDDVQAAILGLLAKHPADRPSTAQDLAELFQAIQVRHELDPTPIRVGYLEDDDLTRPRREPGVAPPVQTEKATVQQRSPTDEPADTTAATRHRGERPVPTPTTPVKKSPPSRRRILTIGTLLALTFVTVLSLARLTRSSDPEETTTRTTEESEATDSDTSTPTTSEEQTQVNKPGAPPTPPGDVAVTVTSGGITLAGAVPSQALANRLQGVAASAYEESQIDNQITVDPDATPLALNLSGVLNDPSVAALLTDRFGELSPDGNFVNDLQLDEASRSVAVAKDLASLEPILFEPGTATLLESSQSTLDEVAEILRAFPDVSVEVGGHTDSRGHDMFNLDVSQRRADSVVSALQERGVTNTFVAVGFGETQLLHNPDDTLEQQKKNRRIEFKIL